MLQQDDLLTQKVELILEMNSKKLLTEISKLREEVAALKSDISELKKRPTVSVQQPPPQYAQQPQQYPSQQQSLEQGYSQGFQRQQDPEHPQNWQPRNEQQEAPQPKNQPIDRNGVAPADVDIQKMFYFGNKKK